MIRRMCGMFLVLAGCAIFMSSCGTSSPRLYDWADYDQAAFGYIKTPTEANVARIMKVSEKVINEQGAFRRTPPPGVCADYGYLLIQNGREKEGKAMLLKEIELYPESTPFVTRILKRFDK